MRIPPNYSGELDSLDEMDQAKVLGGWSGGITNPARAAPGFVTGPCRNTGAWSAREVRGKSNRKSTWEVMFIDVPLEETEQGHDFVAEEFPGFDPMGHVAGIAAFLARIGQAEEWQQEKDAQQFLPLAVKDKGSTACAHHQVSAATRNHALSGRDIYLSYHKCKSHMGNPFVVLLHVAHHINPKNDGEQRPECGA